MKSLQAHALVSMPTLKDRNFYKSIVHVCHHTTQGAFGFITNRKMDIQVAQNIAEHLGVRNECIEKIFWGGPCSSDTVMVLHTSDYEIETTKVISDWLHLTRDRKVIRDIIANKGPFDYKIILGHSAWAPGQLEHELDVQKTWTSFPSDIHWAMETELYWEDALAHAGEVHTSELLDRVFNESQ